MDWMCLWVRTCWRWFKNGWKGRGEREEDMLRTGLRNGIDCHAFNIIGYACMWRKMYFLTTLPALPLEDERWEHNGGVEDKNENEHENENMCTETPNSNDYSAKIVQLYPAKFNINAKEKKKKKNNTLKFSAHSHREREKERARENHRIIGAHTLTHAQVTYARPASLFEQPECCISCESSV